jgi:hypothetical protein
MLCYKHNLLIHKHTVNLHTHPFTCIRTEYLCTMIPSSRVASLSPKVLRSVHSRMYTSRAQSAQGGDRKKMAAPFHQPFDHQATLWNREKQSQMLLLHEYVYSVQDNNRYLQTLSFPYPVLSFIPSLLLHLCPQGTLNANTFFHLGNVDSKNKNKKIPLGYIRPLVHIKVTTLGMEPPLLPFLSPPKNPIHNAICP